MMTADKLQRDSSLNEKQWSSILDGAKSRLEEDGYWIFSAGNTDRKTVVELADCFGKRQSHVLTDGEGIHEVSTKSYHKKTAIVKQQYLGNTNKEHKLHTDGVYLDGIAKTKEGRLVSVVPPVLVLMQMAQPAESGGASLVLDSKQMLEDALHQDHELVKVLLQPCVVYSRDDQCARTPVFTRIGLEGWSIRWRYDFATLVEEDACDALKLFYEKYISNPKYLKRFELQAGDILVVDNLRCIHGREAFTNYPEKPRLLRRVWVGAKEQLFVNPLGQAKHKWVYDQYQSYRCLEVEARKPLIKVSTGIRLNPDSQAIASRLLFDPFDP